MKTLGKLITVIVLFLSLYSATTKTIYAHPMDNTDTYIQVKNDYDNTSINSKTLKIYSYISWYIAGEIYFKKTGNKTTEFEQLLTLNKEYSQYVFDRLVVKNNNVNCVGQILYNTQNDSLSMGALVTITYTCPDSIENLEINNTVANDIFELPTNFMTIQIGDKVLERISLGKQNTVMSFNLPSLEKNPLGDMSVDYTANYSTADVLKTEINNTTNANESGSKPISTSGPKNNSFLSGLADVIFLKANNAKNQPLPVLLLFVFLLGLLHTLEAGHSKAILTSNLLNNKVTFKQSLLYVLVFTATHLGDIVIIGVLFLILNNFYDVFSRFGLIEKFAGFAVFFLAAYMLMKSIMDYVKSKVLIDKNTRHIKTTVSSKFSTAKSDIKNDHNTVVHDHDHNNSQNHNHHTHDHVQGHSHNHPHDHHHIEEIFTNKNLSFKNQIMIGVLTGIAPCIFGWSIFMLVVSTGNLWLLFPVILSFGFGIFVALSIVAFFVTKIRSLTVGKISFLADISPILSALFLLIYSLLIIS